MTLAFDDAKVYFPPGLSDKQLTQLYGDISRLNERRNYYSILQFNHLLQGDVIDGAYFPQILSDGIQEGTAKVLLISNSCDIALENERNFPRRVTIAPVMRVDRWVQWALDRKVPREKVDAQLQAAKNQRISAYFYLPQSDRLPESLVLLDNVQSVPIEKLGNALERRIHVLSNVGFWILLLKLTILLSRPHEGVTRNE